MTRIRLVNVLSRSYSTEAARYFAAMTTQESPTVKRALDAFIRGLKTDGLWDKIDGGNILALGTAQAGYVDFKSPTRVATVAGSPTHTFTAYRGFTGSSAASGSQTDYLDTGFTPSTAGGVFTQNSAQISVWSRTSAVGSNFDIGANSTHDFFYRLRASDLIDGRANDGTTATLASSVTDGSGFFTVSRTASTTITSYRNGSQIGTQTTTSTGLPAATIRYLQLQGLAGSARQLSAAVYGAGLNATEAANLYARINTLLTVLFAL